MSGIIGGFLAALGIVLVVATISHIEREWDEINSPFLWVFLFIGLMFVGLGALMMLF